MPFFLGNPDNIDWTTESGIIWDDMLDPASETVDPIDRNWAWFAAGISTGIHFCAFWLSMAGGGAMRLELFGAGILFPMLLLGYVARRRAGQVVRNGLLGLGLGMFSVLPAGILFFYLGPPDKDYYEGLMFLMIIFVLPLATAGGALALHAWLNKASERN